LEDEEEDSQLMKLGKTVLTTNSGKHCILSRQRPQSYVVVNSNVEIYTGFR